ncbi:MAG: M23 family metallopeptidase [Nitrospirota bacterium]|nr:M23 family metallopeptidase [Nitrospirota bacterium]
MSTAYSTAWARVCRRERGLRRVALAAGAALGGTLVILALGLALSLTLTTAALAAAGEGVFQIPQGGVGRIEVTIRPGDSAPWGSFRAHPVPFVHAEASDNRFVGLIGADMQSSPGTEPLEVKVRRDGQSVLLARLTVEITKVDFPEQRVDGVPDETVNPSPKSLRRIKREKAAISHLWVSGPEAPLWRDAWRSPVGAEPSGRFGYRRVFNGEPRSPHNGEDFPAPSGTPVSAPNRGVARIPGDYFFGGNTVFLEHGGGLFTFYMHLSAITVKDGQQVEAGDVIGRVGATGRATGPHLHWGGRLDGARINPLWLTRDAPVYRIGPEVEGTPVEAAAPASASAAPGTP